MSSEEFIPQFQCKSAIDGVIHIQISNIDELRNNNSWRIIDDCMQLIYRSIPYPTVQDSNTSTVTEESVKNILVGHVGEFGGDLYIRVPVYLHSYDLEMGIKAKDTQNHKWFQKSPTQTIHIPSFLSDTIYSVGDIVNFCNPLNCRASKGTIIEELKDRNYKILYHKYDEENFGEKAHELIAHISTIHRQMSNRPILQIPDPKRLLIKRNDTQSIDIFLAINRCCLCIYGNYCLYLYKTCDFLFHWQSMAYFVTKNVFEYLYCPQFCYNIDCLVDHTHSTLKLSNLRVKDIKNDYELLRNGVDGVQIDVNSFDDIEYSCGVCRRCLKEWDYVYSCCAKDWHQRHDFCLSCVQTVIQLNEELYHLLCDILHDHLNVDCIETIVHCVMGRVLYTEFDCLSIEEDVNEISLEFSNDKKRKLIHKKIPNAKRRKLNEI